MMLESDEKLIHELHLMSFDVCRRAADRLEVRTAELADMTRKRDCCSDEAKTYYDKWRAVTAERDELAACLIGTMPAVNKYADAEMPFPDKDDARSPWRAHRQRIERALGVQRGEKKE